MSVTKIPKKDTVFPPPGLCTDVATFKVLLDCILGWGHSEPWVPGDHAPWDRLGKLKGEQSPWKQGEDCLFQITVGLLCERQTLLLHPCQGETRSATDRQEGGGSLCVQTTLCASQSRVSTPGLSCWYSPKRIPLLPGGWRRVTAQLAEGHPVQWQTGGQNSDFPSNNTNPAPSPVPSVSLPLGALPPQIKVISESKRGAQLNTALLMWPPEFC